MNFVPMIVVVLAAGQPTLSPAETATVDPDLRAKLPARSECVTDAPNPYDLQFLAPADCGEGTWLPVSDYLRMAAMADVGEDCRADTEDRVVEAVAEVRQAHASEIAELETDLAVQRVRSAAYQAENERLRAGGGCSSGWLDKALGALAASAVGAGLGAGAGAGVASLEGRGAADGAVVGAIIGASMSAVAVLVYEVIK